MLAIPEKRFDTTLISYLIEPEIDALLAAPDRSTWTGRRDHALLLLAVQTGLRASELASLRCQDLNLDAGAWVRCEGKGRKEEVHTAQPHHQTGTTRLATRTRRRARRSAVPKPHGGHLTRSAIWRLVVKHTATAREPCPSLAGQEHHPARAAPHRSDATAARPEPGRYRNDRAVARPRNARLHQQVPARRHGTQTTRDRPHHTHRTPNPAATAPPDQLLAFLESL